MTDELTDDEKEELREMAEGASSRKEFLQRLAGSVLQPDLKATPAGTSTVGTMDDAATLYATLDPFDGMVPSGGSAYVETLQLQAGRGMYEITAEGDTVVIKHLEGDDDG